MFMFLLFSTVLFFSLILSSASCSVAPPCLPQGHWHWRSAAAPKESQESQVQQQRDEKEQQQQQELLL